MNKTQLLIMWVGIAIVVLMGIFPPWATIVQATHHYLGHSFILLTPRLRPNATIIFIDLTRLLPQWIMVAVIVGGMIISFKDKKPKDNQE